MRTTRKENVSFGIDLDRVLGMVTLGAPRTTAPEIMDMTRGALRITHEEFPGLCTQSLYITVIGNVMEV
jgi:hypothetical protein